MNSDCARAEQRPPTAAVNSPTVMSRWQDKAACLEENPELFFPIGTTGPALDQIARAKAVCQRCPVMSVCLEWALQTRQEAGVWGGLDEEERRLLRRTLQRARRRPLNRP